MPFYKHGFIGQYLWGSLDRLSVGHTFKADQMRIYNLLELTTIIKSLPADTLWRHNQAGDLQSELGNRRSLCRTTLRRLTTANKGRRGFTFTHYDMTDPFNRSVVREANEGGFTVNLSADNLSHADKLASYGVAPVTVTLPAETTGNCKTPEGHTVVICPAVTRKNVTCFSCGLCSRQRRSIVGFPAIGINKHQLTAG